MKYRFVKGICILSAVLMLGTSITALAKDTDQVKSDNTFVTESLSASETADIDDTDEAASEVDISGGESDEDTAGIEEADETAASQTEADETLVDEAEAAENEDADSEEAEDESSKAVVSSAATATTLSYMNYDLSANDTNPGKYECVAEITSGKTAYTYTTKQLKPKITVSYVYHATEEEIANGAPETSKVTLKSSLYTVTYKNNVNAGIAYITVKGVNEGTSKSKLASLNKSKNTATGKRVIKFRINPVPLSKVTVKLSKSAFYYTGSALKPTVKLVYKNTVLTKNKDYIMAYKNCVYAGTATVKLKAKSSNYSGRSSANYRIVIRRPKIVAKALNYKTIRLHWSTIAKVTGYELFRKAATEDKYVRIAVIRSSTTTTYDDKTAAYGEVYSYKVRAYIKVDGVVTRGKCSPKKDTIVKSLAAPTAVSATYMTATTCKVRWSKVAGASGYMVYEATAASGKYTLVSTITKGTTLAKNIGSLKSGKKYYFKVRAYRLNGTKKVYAKASAAAAETGFPSEASSIDSSKRLAYLFPDGVPTTQAQMKKYLSNIKVSVLSTKKATKTSTMTLTVHTKLAKVIKKIFVGMVNIKFPISDAGAYCWRAVNNGSGSGNRSHHSYGCCVDINVGSNPMISSSGTNVTGGKYRPGVDQYSVTEDCVAVWKKYGFGWGGAWKNSKDYMHFSYTNC